MKNDYDYLVDLGQDYLAHYGVIGMKWGVRKNPYVAKGRALMKLRKLKRKGKFEKAKKWQSKMNSAFKYTPAGRVSDKNLIKLAKADRSVRRTAIAGGTLGLLARSAVSNDFRNKLNASAAYRAASKHHNKQMKMANKVAKGKATNKHVIKMIESGKFRDQNVNYGNQYINQIKDKKKRKK